MSERWDEKIDQKALYDLFPLDPSKQGGRIAGSSLKGVGKSELGDGLAIAPGGLGLA